MKKLREPKNEKELVILLDELYSYTKSRMEYGRLPNITGLMEIMQSETVITVAIHNIKQNSGRNTKGVDGESMATDILQKNYHTVVNRVQQAFNDYKPQKIRRVMIPKPGKSEKRPLGIPTIIDRVIQECVRLVIEPVLEAQFFNHSYGFRPMRDTKQALERIADIVHKSGYHWVIEGDISKYFDTINHNKLLHLLWGMGIKDKRVLMMIKAMLQAGILGETDVNELGTAQGGIISPLLANVYLHSLDKWITREWEDKRLRTKAKYATNKASGERYREMKKTKLKPAFFIRYADDWVLITNTHENAIKWKARINNYLANELKLKLSDEKTLITNIRKRPIRFLGYELKVVKGKARKGYITRSYPNRDRLKSKIADIKHEIYRIRHSPNLPYVANQIMSVNSKIRGLIEYYKCTTWGVMEFKKYADIISYAAYKSLKEFGGSWLPANQVDNLPSVHANYASPIPTITINGMKMGITKLTFFKWEKSGLKCQMETPYSPEGRKLYYKRSNKKTVQERADDFLTTHHSLAIAINMSTKNRYNGKYNFEYFLNRTYAYRRDRGKCRVCGKEILTGLHTHHISPSSAYGSGQQGCIFSIHS